MLAVHVLTQAPLALRSSEGLRFGSYKGGLPLLDLGRSPRGLIADFLSQKRWIYNAFASEEVFIGCAVVSLSYATSALLFVADLAEKRLLFDASFMGGPLAARFTDGGQGDRSAVFRGKAPNGRTARLGVGDHGLHLEVPGALRVRVSSRPGSAAPAIGAVVPVEGGYANATEKRYVGARGSIEVFGDAPRRFFAERALLGVDHTRGYLARRTAWRWAYMMGETTQGKTVVVNLVEGFVGEPECSVWIDGVLHPVGEGRFSYDPAEPLSPWRVTTTCGAVDLQFKPFAIHREKKDLVIVKSNFLQPVGGWSGTVRLPEARGGGTATHFLDDVPGVSEHQDVLW